MPNNDLFTLKVMSISTALARTIIDLGARRSGDYPHHARAQPCYPETGAALHSLPLGRFPTPSSSGIPRSPSRVARPSSRDNIADPPQQTPPCTTSSTIKRSTERFPATPSKTQSPCGRSPAPASARTHRQNEQGIYPRIYPTENQKSRPCNTTPTYLAPLAERTSILAARLFRRQPAVHVCGSPVGGNGAGALSARASAASSGASETPRARGSGATREGQWGGPPLINPLIESRAAQERERDTGETRAPLKSAPARLALRNISSANVFAAAVMHVPPHTRASGRAATTPALAPPPPEGFIHACHPAKLGAARGAGVSMAQGTAKNK
ncbi:hypothetical protein B0H14DRAFT_3876432 [Mycena olivaceomarginata]|nr:hypothetical protein B0H14DRAFT_3876432 [Mycena olivaceomarginata]